MSETAENETLSHRLNRALGQLAMNQSELARRIGVKPQVIQYLCTQNAHKSRFTTEIADALGISVRWLSTGEGNMFTSADVGEPTQHPVAKVDWNALAESGSTKTLRASDWVFTDHEGKYPLFALNLPDDAMLPTFMHGALLIFEERHDAPINSYVIAHFKNQNSLMFRRYELREGKEYLVPINSTVYQTVSIEKEHITVLGVLKEARHYY